MGQKLNEVIDSKRGFVSYGWECIDLTEEALINTLIQWGSSGSSDASGNETHPLRPLSDKDGKLRLDCNAYARMVFLMVFCLVVSDFSLEASKIFCPRVFSQEVCVGRVLIYRQQK